MKIANLILICALLTAAGCAEWNHRVPDNWTKHVATNAHFSVRCPPDWKRITGSMAMGDLDLDSPRTTNAASRNHIWITLVTNREHPEWKSKDDFLGAMRSAFTSNPPSGRVSFGKLEELSGRTEAGNAWSAFRLVINENNQTNLNIMAVLETKNGGLINMLCIAPLDTSSRDERKIFQMLNSVKTE